MKYNEKIRYAELFLKSAEEGLSYEVISQNLSSTGLYDFDLKEIRRSFRKMIFEKYKSQVVMLLVKEKSLSSSEELSGFHDSILSILQEEGIDEIKNQSKSRVRSLRKMGLSQDEIVEGVKNPYFGENEIIEFLEVKNKEIKRETNTVRTGILLGGLGLIALGIVLTWFSKGVSNDGGFRVYYGAVLFGLFLVFKAISIDASNPGAEVTT